MVVLMIDVWRDCEGIEQVHLTVMLLALGLPANPRAGSVLTSPAPPGIWLWQGLGKYW